MNNPGHSNVQAGSGWQERYAGGSPEAEARIIKTFIDQIKEVQFRNERKGAAPAIARAFHAKILAGVTNAEFRILPDIPAELQVGLFQPGKVYQAAVRFSNASGLSQADTDQDLRGAAIRVITEQGHAHDFLMTNADPNHARDAQQFMKVALAAAKARSRLGTAVRLILALGPGEGLRILRQLSQQLQREVKSLATEVYWSRAPIKFGPFAVKFSLHPPSGVDDASRAAGDNYLREDFLTRLKEGPIAFDFKIQRFVDETQTPIEDGAVRWEAELETIAQLVIPQQDLLASRGRSMHDEVNEMAFNPWHTSDDFRPLGSLNRARKIVYKTSADYRTERQNYQASGCVGGLLAAIFNGLFGWLNRLVIWHRQPLWPSILSLLHLRNVLREKNLYDRRIPDFPPGAEPAIKPIPSAVLGKRTPDGTYNDLSDPLMGSASTRFGRNAPPDKIFLNPPEDLLKPSPRVVSRRLMTRHTFTPVLALNLLAASWIQFQNHGWFNHIRMPRREAKESDFIRVPLDQNDDWVEDPMLVPHSVEDRPELRGPGQHPAFINTESHWWDSSQVYGSSEEKTNKLRSFKDGKMILTEQGLLQATPGTGIDITGFNDNYWLGLSMLHTLFTADHNRICDRLMAAYPTWDDERLFHQARLINAAVMAKIHTVEWTPAILQHPALQVGMAANWWGLVGRQLTDLLGRISESEAISGIPGSPPDHHSAPFSLTEEFVSVYRLHPLIPDDYSFYSHQTGQLLAEKTMPEITGKHTRGVAESIPMDDLFYSFGLAHPGAITLHNFPHALQNFERVDGEMIDLAAVDVLRDRERGVPRYNDFREMLHRPRVKSFEEITNNPQWVEEMRQVYEGNVDMIDLQVGLFAETPPKGFAFSDTAFRIFILMASRRLKSDRFFTTDFTEEVYTPEGMAWIRANDMRTVILRHYPELGPALQGVENTFFPWNRLH